MNGRTQCERAERRAAAHTQIDTEERPTTSKIEVVMEVVQKNYFFASETVTIFSRWRLGVGLAECTRSPRTTSETQLRKTSKNLRVRMFV